VELDEWLLFQGNDNAVEGLIRLPRLNSRVVGYRIAIDRTAPTRLEPGQMKLPATFSARWFWRELLPIAIGALLDYQPTLVTGVPEGLA
jgi:hypothetical protein